MRIAIYNFARFQRFMNNVKYARKGRQRLTGINKNTEYPRTSFAVCANVYYLRNDRRSLIRLGEYRPKYFDCVEHIFYECTLNITVSRMNRPKNDTIFKPWLTVTRHRTHSKMYRPTTFSM